MKICVLLGGASPERNVSLSSGISIGQTLEKMGHQLLYLDPATPLAEMDTFRKNLKNISMDDMDFEGMAKRRDPYFIDQIPYLKKEKVDLVFNALHGGNGENGVISAVLEMAGIPYTGSGYAASALAMDKYRTKILAADAGVLCADYEIHTLPVRRPDRIAFPLVVKPNDAGSSVGVGIFHEPADLLSACREALKFSNSFIIESFIPGREFNIPVVAGEIYPVLEVDPGGTYDFNAKYLGHHTKYLVPAPIPSDITESMQDQALKIYHALGLRNYARVDFRMTPEEKIFLLEANTLPGMTASSLVPKSAKAKGIDFPRLLKIIIDDVTQGASVANKKR